MTTLLDRIRGQEWWWKERRGKEVKRGGRNGVGGLAGEKVRWCGEGRGELPTKGHLCHPKPLWSICGIPVIWASMSNKWPGVRSSLFCFAARQRVPG